MISCNRLILFIFLVITLSHLALSQVAGHTDDELINDSNGYCNRTACVRKRNGIQFEVGAELYSKNGRAVMKMLRSGNLVVECGKETVWMTHTAGTVAYGLDFQGNGNLIIYNYEKVDQYSYRHHSWTSDTKDMGGFYLIVSDDGNIQLLDVEEQIVWTTGYEPLC